MVAIHMPLLGSIDAMRPVFMIVMGVFLMLIAWRLAKGAHGWTGWSMVGGAMLLGFGYTILLPLYELGRIESYQANGHYHGNPAVAAGWHAVKLVVMNGGWLLFGLGVASHARLFATSSVRKARKPRTVLSHESVA